MEPDLMSMRFDATGGLAVEDAECSRPRGGSFAALTCTDFIPLAVTRTRVEQMAAAQAGG